MLSRPRSHPWHDLGPGLRAPEEITVVVETPANSRNKYEPDKDCGLFKLDVVVLMKEPSFTGCIVAARQLGVFRMHDRNEPDDKILAVPIHDPYYEEYSDITDRPQHILREIDYFFATYKALEGKTAVTNEWERASWPFRRSGARSIYIVRSTLRRRATEPHTSSNPGDVP